MTGTEDTLLMTNSKAMEPCIPEMPNMKANLKKDTMKDRESSQSKMENQS